MLFRQPSLPSSRPVRHRQGRQSRSATARSIFWPVLALGLGACAGEEPQIWLLQAPLEEDLACAELEVSHNFTGASLPVEETPEPTDWTSSQSSLLSEELFFVQLVPGENDQGLLVVGDEVYPGMLSDGVWTFTWLGEEDTESVSSYLSDYQYVYRTSLQYEVRIALILGDGVGSGMIEVGQILSQSWAESDGWPKESGLATGKIPSATYLVLVKEDGSTTSVRNTLDGDECVSNNCELQTVQTCQSSRAFQATLTGYGPDYDYASLEGTGQAAGL